MLLGAMGHYHAPDHAAETGLLLHTSAAWSPVSGDLNPPNLVVKKSRKATHLFSARIGMAYINLGGTARTHQGSAVTRSSSWLRIWPAGAVDLASRAKPQPHKRQKQLRDQNGPGGLASLMKAKCPPKQSGPQQLGDAVVDYSGYWLFSLAQLKDLRQKGCR